MKTLVNLFAGILVLISAFAVGKPKEPTFNEEVILLARTIYTEAGGEPYAGKVAVGHAVLNRVNNKEFPNTVLGVVSQRGQFQWYHNKRLQPRERFNPKKHTEIITIARKLYVENVLDIRRDTTGGAIFFSSNGVRPAPRAIKPMRVGRHVFYRLKALKRV